MATVAGFEIDGLQKCEVKGMYIDCMREYAPEIDS